MDWSSVADLIAHDERSPLPAEEFDDALWLLLQIHIDSPDDLDRYPRPVLLYFASRYLQWDVGNGGFAQAAFNIPQWFELAEEWYQLVGKSSSASLIREAIKLLPNEQREIQEQGLEAGTIADVFEHFDSSRMSALDDRIVGDDWYVDDERVNYVRRNREAFQQVK